MGFVSAISFAFCVGIGVAFVSDGSIEPLFHVILHNIGNGCLADAKRTGDLHLGQMSWVVFIQLQEDLAPPDNGFESIFLWMIVCSLLTSVSDKEIIYFLGLAIVSYLFIFRIPYITIFINQTSH